MEMQSDWTEVAAEWRGDLEFDGRNESGGCVRMRASEENPGVTPMEMLLLGLAGCTGIDVVHILRKKRQPLRDLRVQVRARRADNHPKVYTEIELTYLLVGDGLKESAVKHAISLSENKFCSATAMLGKTATIRSTYRIGATSE